MRSQAWHKLLEDAEVKRTNAENKISQIPGTVLKAKVTEKQTVEDVMTKAKESIFSSIRSYLYKIPSSEFILSGAPLYEKIEKLIKKIDDEFIQNITTLAPTEEDLPKVDEDEAREMLNIDASILLKQSHIIRPETGSLNDNSYHSYSLVPTEDDLSEADEAMGRVPRLEQWHYSKISELQSGLLKDISDGLKEYLPYSLEQIGATYTRHYLNKCVDMLYLRLAHRLPFEGCLSTEIEREEQEAIARKISNFCAGLRPLISNFEERPPVRVRIDLSISEWCTKFERALAELKKGYLKPGEEASRYKNQLKSVEYMISNESMAKLLGKQGFSIFSKRKREMNISLYLLLMPSAIFSASYFLSHQLNIMPGKNPLLRLNAKQAKACYLLTASIFSGHLTLYAVRYAPAKKCRDLLSQQCDKAKLQV